MMRYAWMIVATAALGCAGWYAWPNAAEPESAVVKPPAQVHTSSTPYLSLPANWPPAFPATTQAQQRVALPPLAPPVAAALSMSEARVNGDSRTPPIQRDAAPTEQPTAAELADPAAYQQFEARQNMRLRAAFTQAAATEVPRLRDDLERGRAAGIPADQLAKVEEKVRRIEEMRERLRQEHPQLGR